MTAGLTRIAVLYVQGVYARRENQERDKRKNQERLTRKDGSMMTLAQSKRATDMQKDNNAWDENRMISSGVASRKLVRSCFPLLSV